MLGSLEAVCECERVNENPKVLRGWGLECGKSAEVMMGALGIVNRIRVQKWLGFLLRHGHRRCMCMEGRAQLGKVQQRVNEGRHLGEVIGLMLGENKVHEFACVKMG